MSSVTHSNKSWTQGGCRGNPLFIVDRRMKGSRPVTGVWGGDRLVGPNSNLWNLTITPDPQGHRLNWIAGWWIGYWCWKTAQWVPQMLTLIYTIPGVIYTLSLYPTVNSEVFCVKLWGTIVIAEELASMGWSCRQWCYVISFLCFSKVIL